MNIFLAILVIFNLVAMAPAQASAIDSQGSLLIEDNAVVEGNIQTLDTDGINDFAGQLRIQGGNPDVNKVLTAIDNFGLAEWQDLVEVVNESGAQLAANGVQIAIFSDKKDPGTPGGTFSAANVNDDGGWKTRELNTIDALIGDFVTLNTGGNSFNLKRGTYRIRASAPAFQVNSHQTRLVNDFSLVAILGTSEFSIAENEGEQTRSFIDGIISIVAPFQQFNFRLQHKAQTGKATNGFGIGTNFADTQNVYSVIVIEKLVDPATVSIEPLAAGGDFSNNGEDVAADRTLGNNDPVGFGIETNDQTRIYISGDTPNVGIGTTDPSATLHLDGSLRIQDTTEAQGRVLSSDDTGVASWQDVPAIEDPITCGYLSRNQLVGNVFMSIRDLANAGGTGTCLWKDGNNFGVIDNTFTFRTGEMRQTGANSASLDAVRVFCNAISVDSVGVNEEEYFFACAEGLVPLDVTVDR